MLHQQADRHCQGDVAIPRATLFVWLKTDVNNLLKALIGLSKPGLLNEAGGCTEQRPGKNLIAILNR